MPELTRRVDLPRPEDRPGLAAGGARATGRPPSARWSSTAGPSPWCRWSTTSTSAWSRTDGTRSGKTLLEVPAGTIDPGESPDQTAERELLEETGYRPAASAASATGTFSPGVMNERMYLYLCEDLEPGPADLELDEQLEPVIVPWDEALAMVDDGRIEDAKTMLALMICDRMRRSTIG